jgi:RNA polymerase sigma-70 factor (ECF subfamily)
MLFLPQLDAVYNLARWIVGADQNAQKIVQEAYAQALNEFPRFRGGNPRAWLLTIVRDTANRWIKTKDLYAEKLAVIDQELTAAPLLLATSEQCHERQREILEKVLNRLPAEFREVLVLFELEGWSYKTIATALDVPVQAVMSRLSRARRSLQAELRRSGLSRTDDG